MKNTVRLIKGLTFTAVLALSLIATSGSAAAKTDKTLTDTVTPVVGSTGSGFSALGVTWE